MNPLCSLRMFSIWLIGLVSFAAFVQAQDEDKMKVGNVTIDRTVQLRTHSIFAPYIDQDLQNRWWDFGADSYVNTNKHIRLTRNRPSQMGWLWARLPLTSSNFVIEVEFKISGSSSHLFGDGIAMWLTTDRAEPGPVFGNKDKFNGLGIFFDTYANSRHTYSFPRIAAMLGDGQTSYDYGNDGDGQMIGGCSLNFRRTNVATKLKLIYIKDRFLDVKVQYKAWDEWTDCFFVEGVKLPHAPFLGFSAMTGDVSDDHDIISVATSSVIILAPHPDKLGASAGRGPSPTKGSWGGLLVRLFLFGGLCVGGYFGYKEYLKRSRYGGYGRGGFGGTTPKFGGFGGGAPAYGGGGMYSSNHRY